MPRTLSLATEAFAPEFFTPVKLAGSESVNQLFSYSLIIKTPDKNNLSMTQQENYSSAELTSWLGKPIQVGLQLDGKSIELNEVVDTIRRFWREHIRGKALVTSAALFRQQNTCMNKAVPAITQ